MFQPRTRPPSVMGFNPFEYGLQQIPLHTPFFNHFFKPMPHSPFPHDQSQQGQPFQMDNPFSSSFMNPNLGQMNNPFSHAFFNTNPPTQRPTYQGNPPHQHNLGAPQPASNFDFKKIGSGVQKAIGIYNQVKPMWNLFFR